MSDYLAHTGPLFKKCKVVKVSDLCSSVLAQYVYKLKRGHSGAFEAEHSYNTCHHSEAVPAFRRLSLTQHAVPYAAPQAWNAVPIHIQSAETLFQFKKKLKDHYTSSYE